MACGGKEPMPKPSMRHAVVKVKGPEGRNRSFEVGLVVCTPWTEHEALANQRRDQLAELNPKDHYGVLSLPEQVLRNSRQG